jgi:hypothetical protein
MPYARGIMSRTANVLITCRGVTHQTSTRPTRSSRDFVGQRWHACEGPLCRGGSSSRCFVYGRVCWRLRWSCCGRSAVWGFTLRLLAHWKFGSRGIKSNDVWQDAYPVENTFTLGFFISCLMVGNILLVLYSLTTDNWCSTCK